MRLLVFLLSLLGFLGGAALALDGKCNCAVDHCVDSALFAPFTTVCWANGTVDQEVNATQGPTGFQACQNATYVDMFARVNPESVANTTNCQLLMTTFLDPTFETNYILAAQLYNNTMLSLGKYGDCFLVIGGGAGATPDAIDVDDNFWIGNMDLAYAVSNSIISYADDGNATSIAACGTLPYCGFNNSATGQVPDNVPDVAWCIGGPQLGESWLDKNGTYGWPTQSQDTLPVPELDYIPVLQTDSELALDSSTSDIAVHNFSAAIQPPPPAPKSRVVYTLNCGSKGEQVWTVARCAIYFDTSCDENGKVRSGSYECYRKCSCIKQVLGGKAPGGVCYVGGKSSQKCVRDVESAETLHIGEGTDTDANTIDNQAA